MNTSPRMKRNKLIPSDDIYTYHSQALDMLDVNHPHYEEIQRHLLAQIRDELADRYNRRADATGENPDSTGTETAA